MSKALLTIFICLLVVANPKSKVIDHISPLNDEFLKHPIHLKNNCSGIVINEWRPSKGKTHTAPSKRAINIINKTCNTAVAEFPKYIKSKGFHLKNKDRYFAFNISMIPFDPNTDGKEYRNLNDNTNRFLHRFKTYNRNGEPYPIYGYMSRAGDDYIYLRNDPLDKDYKENYMFVLVFSHELYHAMSYRYDIISQLKGKNLNEEEEDMAYGFTNYLGLGK